MAAALFHKSVLGAVLMSVSFISNNSNFVPKVNDKACLKALDSNNPGHQGHKLWSTGGEYHQASKHQKARCFNWNDQDNINPWDSTDFALICNYCAHSTKL